MTEKTTEKMTDAERSRRKIREGYVVSDKMDKTVVVAVEDRVKHRLYGKVLRQTSRLKAHDEQNAAAIGDREQSVGLHQERQYRPDPERRNAPKPGR